MPSEWKCNSPSVVNRSLGLQSGSKSVGRLVGQLVCNILLVGIKHCSVSRLVGPSVRDIHLMQMRYSPVDILSDFIW